MRVKRKIGGRLSVEHLPEFLGRKVPEHLRRRNTVVMPGLDSSDLLWLGDDAEKSDDEVEALLSELLQPSRALSEILRALIRDHPNGVDGAARLDRALAAILGTEAPR